MTPSGSLARQNKHHLLQPHQQAGELFKRVFARLIELAELLADENRIHSLINIKQEKNRWIGQAPRGVLSHQVSHQMNIKTQTKDRLIESYHITTPTDRHCREDGILYTALQHQSVDSPLAAELLIMAIDPCIPFQLEIIPIGLNNRSNLA